ncbi:MAG TPA: penicillin acylase family protein, partial [Polyangia bacterium]|nr:penicillin acylase family protein [Polyangia bacterium]
MRSTSLLLLFPLVFAACSKSGAKAPVTTDPIASVGLTTTLTNPALSAPVDLVRDEHGIPHIYGQTPGDVAFVQGYAMAQDRLVQMELFRHAASGTLAWLLGDLSGDAIDSDIKYRLHGLRNTVTQAWTAMQASTAPDDQQAVQMLTKFAAGVNAYAADLQAGKYTLPGETSVIYSPDAFQTWTEVDSLVLGQIEMFDLAFDADSDIARSQFDVNEATNFVASSDPTLQARKGIAADFEIMTPFDPVYTVPGFWDTLPPGTGTSPHVKPNKKLGPLLAAIRHTVDIGNDHQLHPSRGSNAWAVGPALSSTGHVLIANDTHLYLENPPLFYLSHLVSRGATPLDVMGVQFAGIPGVLLGMNQHTAWGSTVSFTDMTDVYNESVVQCDDGVSLCVMFNGQKVALVPRVETIDVGYLGKVSHTISVTFYDVPQHGPIVPILNADHTLQPIVAGASAISVRFTGYDPAPRLMASIWDLDSASSVEQAMTAVEGMPYVKQNWVIGDDQGNIGYTQYSRVPRRAAVAAPWKVLPGDGSAEWGGDLDPAYIPNVYNPPAGYILSANNDPIGVTANNDPFFSQPLVDGLPLYLGGADYDPGTRADRVGVRLASATSGGGKVTLDDLQAFQADHVDEFAAALQPTFVTAAQALSDAIANPTSHPELTSVLAQATPATQALVPQVLALGKAWSADTPSGVAEDQPTAQQIADSQAATVMEVWLREFTNRTFGDELTVLAATPNPQQQLKLLVRMCTHPELLTTSIDATTGDPILFDVVGATTPQSKLQTAALAVLDSIAFIAGKLGADPTQWRWGALHTLTLDPLAGLPQFSVPQMGDATYPDGFPRSGAFGSVDPGSETIDNATYSFLEGAAMRFVAELDPVNGPTARNTLPGGEIFDPSSPHYTD